MGVRPPAVALLPAEPGVYRFRDDQGRALYIGRAVDLRRRVSSYWGDLRGRSHLRRMVPRIARIEALVCGSEHEAAWAERMLLEHRKPRWNRVVGGLEVSVFVRLDAATPSLSVAHHVAESPSVRWYGPYLGGTATRLAVAALHRVFSLSYTGSRLMGTERDLARVRGADATDAPTVADRIARVLSRDPSEVAAVRTALVTRREAAAAAERYELAAGIHAELGGLDWVVAPVRFLGAADLDLVGCAAGQRISLGLRNGTLRTWEQSSSPDEAPVAPPGWEDFLQVNAALAAALAASPVR